MTDARGQSALAFAASYRAMLDVGVYLPPSAFEALFVSGAHDADDLDRIATALSAAASAAGSALG